MPKKGQNCVLLRLPYPPSVNRYWRRVGNRTVLSREARRFRKRVKDAWIVHTFVHGRKRFADRPVQIKIAVRPPDRRKRDLDNVLKAILDAVEKAGVIDDDAQVRRLEVEFDEPVQDGQVTLVIAPLDTVARRG